MDIAEKLLRTAQNEQLVAGANAELEEALYSKSEGGKSWYDKYAETISIHPEKTVSGSCISANDVSELPHSVKCKVTGVDNPENVTVTRCGKNLLGGKAFAEKIANSISDSVIDRENKTVTLRDSFASGFLWWDKFEPNTRYTVFLKGKNNLITYYMDTNLVCHFTDGTRENLRLFDGNNSQVCWTSPAGKTISQIKGGYNAGTATFEYDYVGLFEGALTLDDFKPYNGQTLTPSADGIVEGMTSISPQMNIFTDNADAMLDVTYRQSKGMQTEYDRFWDAFQQNGKRKQYPYAFSFGWDDINFNPKYPLTGIGQVTYMFYYSSITNVAVDIEITDVANSMFSQCSTLHTVKKMIVSENVRYTSTFYNCNVLANITFEGVIGQSIDFQYSPLTKASITNVIEHLSSTASGQTCTFKKTAKEAAFTDSEWSTLIATKPNWTISLV